MTTRNSLVFIMDNIEGHAAFLADLPEGTEAYVLDSKQDGLRQMADIMAGKQDIDAVHLVSHGNDGSLQLGALTLDAGNLAGHSAELDRIRQALSDDADLLLYGCNTGNDSAFIQQLASLTGADVAASTDLTGNTRAGGNWVLEQQQGLIETLTLKPAGFDGTLINDIDFESFDSYGTTIEIAGWKLGSSSGNYDFSPVNSSLYSSDKYGTAVVASIMSGSAEPFFIKSSNGDNFKLDSFDFFVTGPSWSGLSLFLLSAYRDDGQVTMLGFHVSDSYQYTNVQYDSFDNRPSGFYAGKITLLSPAFKDIDEIRIQPNAYNPDISFGIDNIQVTLVPTTTVTSASLSADTGSSNNDFITATAAQTISGTVSATLASDERVEVSVDNGNTWATASTAGLNWSIGSTLTGNNTLLARVSTTAGSSTAYSQAYTLDTTVPVVSQVSASTANGRYKIGDSIEISVEFSEAVLVSGTPKLQLQTGGSNREASYASGSGSTTLTFTYTVMSGDSSADLDYRNSNALILNGGSIRDTAGNAATLSLPSPGAAGSLGAAKAIEIDGISPAIVAVASPSATTLYKAGDVVQISVQFSEAVTVSGTPQLQLETGLQDRMAVYSSGSGTDTLFFSYTVATADSAARLDYVSSAALGLNGGSIRDTFGNDALLSLPTPGTAGSLGQTQNITIDGTLPTVVSVSSSNNNASYDTGDVIAITVTFSEAVNVTGTPVLALATGGTPRLASYQSGSGSTVLTFSYTVQYGDLAADLDYTGTNALSLAGGSILDVAGNPATLTLPSPGSTGSLGNNKSLVVATLPELVSASYDASSGVLDVTAVKMQAGHTIAANLLTITGEGGASHTLTSSPVSSTSNTAFSITLNANDKAAVNQILNKNGATSTGGTTFNLAGAAGWDVTANAFADTTGNAITVSQVAVPTLTSATYDAATGTLIVTGTGLLALAGAANDINAAKFTLTGEGGISRTLSDTASVEISSATQFTLTLGSNDKAALATLFNKNGTSATGGSAYQLAAAEDWAAGADAAVVVADSTGNAITVSQVAVPTLTSATYDAATGTLIVTGTGLLALAGAANDIDAAKFTLTGEGGVSRTLSDTASVEISSATQFTLTLGSNDKAALATLFNKNGTSATGGSSYQLAAAEDWAAGADAAVVVADTTGNAITVSQVAVPTLTSATYDAATGTLIVTGTGLLALAGAANDIDAAKFTLTGEGGISRTLSDTASVEISSATQFTLTLGSNDKAALATLFNKNGLASASGTSYQLAAAEDWAAGADAAVVVADTTGNAITVSQVAVPTLTSATYDAATGTLIVTGTGLLALAGAANDIDASKFTLTGEGGVSRTLSDTASVEISSATQFTLTLGSNDKAALATLFNKNGTSATGGSAYQLAAAEDWAAGADAAVVVADTTGNAITVSQVAVPTLTSATYDAATGTLVVTGTGLLALAGAANDIDAAKFTLTGEGGVSRTLSDTASVEISSATQFTLTLGSNDKAALATLFNKNGTSATGGSAYQLAAAEDWAAGADAAVVVADTAGNAITVSQVAVPTLTSATYDAATGTLIVTGTGLLALAGAANDIDAAKFTLTGEGGASRTLSDTASVEISSATQFTLTLGSNDKAALATLFNKNGLASASGTSYQLAAAEDWAAGADAAVVVADTTGNAITVSLPPPATQDSDGISDTIENSVPGLPSGNGATVAGDGNGDGLQDSLQTNVSSAAFADKTQPGNTTPVYITLVADSANGKTTANNNTALSEVKQLDKPANAPADLSMPLGLISFKASAGTTGASKQFSLYVDASVQANGYWKQDSSGQWVNLASSQYGGQVVKEGSKTRLDFVLTDGGQFDSDGKADGTITDPGAIGFRLAVPVVKDPNDRDADQFPDALEATYGLQVGIKDNDVFGSSQAFVLQLYRDTLFREAEGGGLRYWQQQLDSGAMSRAAITSTFLDSAEFQAGAGGISRLYLGALNRLPDSDGLGYWVTQWQGGKTLANIASSMVNSPEFNSRFETQSLDGFVDRVYQNVMGRPADTAGKTYWVQQLEKGVSKGDVVLGFTESAEYRQLTDAKVGILLNYLGLLERAPEQAGFDYWLGRAQQGMPEVEIVAAFQALPEYHDRFLPAN